MSARVGLAAALAIAAALAMQAFAVVGVRADIAPRFTPEPFWPEPLPAHWILGQVAGIAADGQDNIWIIHRPTTLLDDEKDAGRRVQKFRRQE